MGIFHRKTLSSSQDRQSDGLFYMLSIYATIAPGKFCNERVMKMTEDVSSHPYLSRWLGSDFQIQVGEMQAWYDNAGLRSVKEEDLFELTEETVVDRIEHAIADWIETHQGGSIDYVLLKPYQACLLFLDRRLTIEQVDGAVSGDGMATIEGVRFLVAGTWLRLNVIVRDDHKDDFKIVKEDYAAATA